MMIMVNSKSLDSVAEQIRERGDPQENREGVRLYVAQCETAARLLREEDKVECNGLTEERPGWIDPELQGADRDVLVFEIGILPAVLHHIDKDGNHREVSFGA